MRVEEKYLDVLQNIEFMIVGLYKEKPALMDSEVADALDALIRRYKWQNEGRGSPKARLFGRSQELFDRVATVCEWRLGRSELGESDDGQLVPNPRALSLEELLLCLQRLRSSVHFWTKERGRQGYLQYVSPFLSQPPGQGG